MAASLYINTISGPRRELSEKANATSGSRWQATSRTIPQWDLKVCSTSHVREYDQPFRSIRQLTYWVWTHEPVRSSNRQLGRTNSAPFQWGAFLCRLRDIRTLMLG